MICNAEFVMTVRKISHTYLNALHSTPTVSTVNQPVYDDLFSDDATKVKNICEKLKGNMMRFKEILNRPRDRRGDYTSGDTARSVSH